MPPLPAHSGRSHSRQPRYRGRQTLVSSKETSAFPHAGHGSLRHLHYSCPQMRCISRPPIGCSFAPFPRSARVRHRGRQCIRQTTSSSSVPQFWQDAAASLVFHPLPIPRHLLSRPLSQSPLTLSPAGPPEAHTPPRFPRPAERRLTPSPPPGFLQDSPSARPAAPSLGRLHRTRSAPPSSRSR